MAPATAETCRLAASAAAGNKLKRPPERRSGESRIFEPEKLPSSFLLPPSLRLSALSRVKPDRTRGTCLKTGCTLRAGHPLSPRLGRVTCREGNLPGPEGSEACPKLRESFAHLANDRRRAAVFCRFSCLSEILPVGQLRWPSLLICAALVSWTPSPNCRWRTAKLNPFSPRHPRSGSLWGPSRARARFQTVQR